MTLEEYKIVPTKEVLENGPEKKSVPPVYGYGVRHVQAFFIFVTYALAYLARAHLGVTVVAMTDEIRNIKENTTIANGTDFTFNSALNSSVTEESVWNIYRTYQWPKSTQEMVLSSFFLGYAVMTFASGIICQKWGGKIPLQIAMFVNGILSILSPWIVAWGGWKALSVCRILQGLSQGGMLPGIHTLLANWVPISERGSLSSYVYTGSGLGTVLGFQISGLLASSRFGWPSTFWTIGVLCLLGFTLMTIFSSATPYDHKTITEAEKTYIIGDSGEGTHTQPTIPWKAIFTSTPVWSAIITHIGVAVGYTFFFMQVPTYMHAILKVNVKNSGLLSSLPYVSFVICCIFFGYFSDVLVNKNILTMKNVRRLSNSVGTLGPGLCIVLVSYTENVTLAVICFVAGLGAQSAMHTGWVVNYIDLSPNYSGALMAIGNGLANFCVLVLPILVSNIVKDVTNQIQWRITMFLIGSVMILGNIIFVIFLSTDVQPWNERGYTDSKDNKLKNEKEVLKSNS
ncbi:putative inorganic phosphate cotransporter [Pieris brassicae]|uniref:putative inorganic phosphate cotransporter n=1 Tax=Pieris brassicae TaxID=7116 RepID=UPI001E66020D|nr:putative inorganic phosphate cotransporter [Pieris brassicae]